MTLIEQVRENLNKRAMEVAQVLAERKKTEERLMLRAVEEAEMYYETRMLYYTNTVLKNSVCGITYTKLFIGTHIKGMVDRKHYCDILANKIVKKFEDEGFVSNIAINDTESARFNNYYVEVSIVT